ncbi:MAG: glycine cleavage system protein H [Candidatus Thorarchaeota archaeon]
MLPKRAMGRVIMQIEGFEFPDDLYYHPEHTWARVEGDLVRVGVTSYAVHIAGEIKAVTPRPKGKEVKIGGPAGMLESNKWVGPLRSPVSGIIVRSNDSLNTDPSPLINDPFGEGWICVIDPEYLDEDLESLFHDEDAIREWMTMEMHSKKEEDEDDD